MSSFNGNKTEDPTPRRRERALQEGQVLFSPDFTSAVLMLFLLSFAGVLGQSWMNALLASLSRYFATVSIAGGGGDHVHLSTRWLSGQLLLLTGPVILIAWSVNLLTTIGQAGGKLSNRAIEFKWERLSIEKGWERLWSLDSAFRSGMSLIKLLCMLAVLGGVSWWHWDTSPGATQGSLTTSIGFGSTVIASLLRWLVGGMLCVGLADFGFRWFRHEQQLRMTREELKDEIKEDQGDPYVRQQRRRLQHQARQQRTLRNVKEATVVVTNPTHFAVALKYTPHQPGAPTILAKGTDRFAKMIIAHAKKHGVPVMERKPLARALYALAGVGQQIPAEFYRAVAEVLAQVYRHKQRT